MKGRLKKKKKYTFGISLCWHLEFHLHVRKRISKINITVQNKPRISLIKLFLSITSISSSKKENNFRTAVIFWGSLLLAFANTCEILSLFRRVATFAGSLLSVLYGIRIRGWFLCNAMQKQQKQKQNKTKPKRTNKSNLLMIAFVRLSHESGF